MIGLLKSLKLAKAFIILVKTTSDWSKKNFFDIGGGWKIDLHRPLAYQNGKVSFSHINLRTKCINFDDTISILVLLDVENLNMEIDSSSRKSFVEYQLLIVHFNSNRNLFL